MVAAPEREARRAARSLVIMPPRPRPLRLSPTISLRRSSLMLASLTRLALGFTRGSHSNSPCWSVRMISRSASSKFATNAPKGSGQEATTVDNRARRVLAKRREIDQLISARSSGMTIIPTKLLTTGRYIKLVIALGKGKRNYDKRETIRRRQTERETARILEKF